MQEGSRLKELADDLFGGLNNENGVAVVMRINGRVHFAMRNLPKVENLTTDDNVGEVGYNLGRSLDELNLATVAAFNKMRSE